MRLVLSFISLLLTLPWVAIAGEAGEKTLAVSTGFGSMLGQMVAVLLLVIVLLMGLAWVLKRAGVNQGVLNGQLAVLGAVSVGQREKVVLIQAGQEQLLVGVTANEISLLHLLSEPIVVDGHPVHKTTSALSDSFAQKLNQAITRRQAKDTAP
ncbi:MAG: flagellar biosynthetic protein FliO [Thiotrichales bacterium]|nr:MAG: flagellar biosynthetic protein FliO [Thiotrichales bacterium]